MNLRQLIKFWFRRDTTFRGEFAAIREALPPDTPHYVVDVGANDGFYGSNAYPFVARGWRALMIEPDPRAFALLERRFAGNTRVACLHVACGAESGVLPLRLGKDPSHSSLRGADAAAAGAGAAPSALGAQSGETVATRVVPLAALLAEHDVPRRYGVLSIDTEGHDLQVLRGADLRRYRPDVIFTETFADDAEERAKHAFLGDAGYRLRAEVDTNTLWTPTAA
ncbi:MAG: FkbM family methyltransferase [Verrucomicrobiales bacterium]|nr:FkbM family methyltransferase [Verrucomicrobiales bacterium]